MSSLSFDRQDEVHEDAKLLGKLPPTTSPRWTGDKSRGSWIRDSLLVLTALFTVLASFFAGALFSGRADTLHTATRPAVDTNAVPQGENSPTIFTEFGAITKENI